MQYRITDTRDVPVEENGDTTYTFEVDVQATQPDGSLLTYTVEVRLVSSGFNWLSTLWVIAHTYVSPLRSNPLAMRCTELTPELEIGSYPVGVEQMAVGHALQVYAQREALRNRKE